MSRAFIAFYMGDYDKDTQALSTIEHGAYFLLLKQCWVHGAIPLDAAKRANIAKLSLKEWNRIAPTIDQFFDPEGRNKRATLEIEKAEEHRIKHVLAGQRGGEKSKISRAIKRSAATSIATSAASSGATSNTTTDASSSASSVAQPIKNRNITSSFVGTARASENPTNSTPETADRPASIAEKAREAVQKNTGIGSGELTAKLRSKGWVKP